MNGEKYHILLIEDDQPLAELVAEYLDSFEFIVTVNDDANSALASVQKNHFDLILCDVMLPDIDGFNLILELQRFGNFPILFMTALSDSESEISGLDLGASDYIVKPVDPPKLLARVRANIRKSATITQAERLTFKNLTLDFVHKRIQYQNKELVLTNQEFELIWFFAHRGDCIVDRETLFSDLIGRQYDGMDRAADLRISRLRKKLETLGADDLRIESIRNKGYVFHFWTTLR